MIEVVVSKLGIDPSNQSYVVVLQEKGGGRLLPIWIGQAEAESIVMHMHNMKRSRPLTHDLCKIDHPRHRLRAAPRADHAASRTTRTSASFISTATAKSLRVDSRPSDAIAIALRLDAPIFASDALLVSG